MNITESMSDADFQAYLAEQTLRLEQLTKQQLIENLKQCLVRAGTGHPIDTMNGYYKVLWEELDSRFHEGGEEHPNPFGDLWQFYEYWKQNGLGTWASRRAYVASLYAPRKPSTLIQTADLLHPTVASLSMPKFNNGHYGDSVETALKELNQRLKQVYLAETGREEDGVSLVQKVFSLKEPILILDDLDTEDGRNIQLGHMEIITGMTRAIRNPLAHKNADMDKLEAMRHLISLSHIFYRLDMVQVKPEAPTPGAVLVGMQDLSNQGALQEMKKIMLDNPGETEVHINVQGRRIRLPFKINPKKLILRQLEAVQGVTSVASDR